MPFKKGQSGNPNGPKVGYKRAKTEFVEMVVDGVAHSLGDHNKCRKFFAKLRDENPKEYARYVVDLAKQFIPRPVEVSGEISHAHKLPPVLEEKLIAVYGTPERA